MGWCRIAISRYIEEVRRLDRMEGKDRNEVKEVKEFSKNADQRLS